MEKIRGIVIHYTANPGSTAQNNRDYFEGLKDSHETSVSSHFVVGLEGETDVFSATFSGHEKELREAFQKLDGRELPQGDVGYEIRAFDCMPMRFFFWERDEEFEAQGNILFDYSATDFNHVESAVSIADSGIKRLAELAGVPLRGKSFQMR